MNDISEYLSAAQLAKQLGISPVRVYVLAKQNRFSPAPASVGGHRVFHKSTTYKRKVMMFV